MPAHAADLNVRASAVDLLPSPSDRRIWIGVLALSLVTLLIASPGPWLTLAAAALLSLTSTMASLRAASELDAGERGETARRLVRMLSAALLACLMWMCMDIAGTLTASVAMGVVVLLPLFLLAALCEAVVAAAALAGAMRASGGAGDVAIPMMIADRYVGLFGAIR